MSKRKEHRMSACGEEKHCRLCDLWLPLVAFGPNKSMWDKLCATCKHCRINERRQERINALRHYSLTTQPSCECCGIDKLEFLAIDHIYGGGNKERKEVASGCSTNFYRWLRRNNWPLGYQVLCHNCNMARGVYGKCPCEPIDKAVFRTLKSGTGGWIWNEIMSLTLTH